MKIGDLAKVTQTQAETIRFYEREGLLLEPPRNDGNYRIYGEEHLVRLSFIRHCRLLDMTLEEIRVLLRFQDAPRENCLVINDVLDEHIEHVARRIQELKELQKELKSLREQCEGVAGICGTMNRLKTADARKPTPDFHIHEGGLGRPGDHARARGKNK